MSMFRYDIINWLIKKYGYNKYLEIGLGNYECFNQVKCASKTGVDPCEDTSLWKQSKGCFEVVEVMESDYFFALSDERDKYDIIFIDGLHLHEQVERDIHNSLKHLAEGGTIVVHDCNPPTADHAAREPRVFKKRADGTTYPLWNGDVWKAWVMTKAHYHDLWMKVVDTDWGCGIIRRLKDVHIGCQVSEIMHDHPWSKFSEAMNREHGTYETMADDRVNVLGLISVKEFRELFSMGVEL